MNEKNDPTTVAPNASSEAAASPIIKEKAIIHGPPLPRYHNSSWSLISQGAEARIWHIPSFLTTSATIPSESGLFQSSPSIAAVCKERFPRRYRHPELDKCILKSRLKAEARCLVRCRRGGVECPSVYGVDSNPKGNTTGSMCLFLEYIDGMTVREFLEQRQQRFLSVTEDPENDTSDNNDDGSDGKTGPPRKKPKTEASDDDEKSMAVAFAIGKLIGKMHNVNVIHGDLTTSNILIRKPVDTEQQPALLLIDFGLSGTAGAKGVSHEEKAVDLHVLERAFEATHPRSQNLVKEIIRSYKGVCTTSDSVFQRLAQVRLRGRKRDCFG